MDVIAKARELGKVLQQDEKVIRLITAENIYANDVNLQITIDKFNFVREQINNEVSKTPRDDEKIQTLNEEMRGYYQTVVESESMINYNQAKKDVDDLLHAIGLILTGSVEGEDPDTISTEEPEGGCGGSCSSCSGCH